ncbi:MAG: hypothetical protein J6R59_13565, partial [Paludibacteraceae bacterium]|nr:hypothetical protein [Paludibacteraceae bacterium]
MERKIHTLMLLIKARAGKYIKSKIGEISVVIRNFMEKERVVLSVSFKFLVAVSCLFFSVAEMEAQLCSGGVRFEKPGCLENPVVDKGVFQIYPGRPDQTQPSCNSDLGNLSGHQYYVSDGIYSEFGGVEGVKLPSEDDSKSYLLYKPSTTNSILTVRVHKLSESQTNQVFVSFRFFYGNVNGDASSPVTGTFIKTNSSNGNYDFYITKDDCPGDVEQLSSGSGGGLDLGTSFCGDKYGWYTMRALITLPEYLDNNFLDIWLEMNFYNQPAGDVIFLDNVLVSYNGTICVEKSMACPGDVLSLTDEVYPYGTAISWQYRYPDNSDQWFDVADPSAGFTFNPDGDFDKQNLQFRAEVTLLDGSKSMTDILEVTTDPKCKPQVSVSPSVACAGDDVNLKTKYYPANSEITWEYRYPGSSDWATIPSGSFISSSGDETSTPFTYNPPQGVSSAEFRAKAKLQDGTEIPVSNVVVVKTTTTCPIYVCEIEDIVLNGDGQGLQNSGYEYYDLNGNRLSIGYGGGLESSFWDGTKNAVVRDVVYERIINNGGVIIKARSGADWNKQLTFTFIKNDNCESLEILGDEPITICEGETPTVTYQLKGAASTYNYVAKLYDKNNVEVNTISGSWTTTANPADVSLILPGNISFGEYSLKLSVNDQEFDAVTRTVTVKQPIAFELSPVSPICKGESVSLSVAGDVAGDVATTDAYQWYKDDVAIAGATATSYEVTPDESAVYKLEVKGNVCPAVSKTVSVEVKENPQVTVTTLPICAGSSDAPIATMTPSDGMTFEWVNAPTWSSLSAGTHTVSYKITSDNGCFVEGTTDVTVEAPIVFELAKAGPICKGESVELKVDGNVIGVVANTDAYQWYEGGVAISGATSATYTASPESTMEYSLTIKGNKCEATTRSVEVEVEEPIDFTLAEVDAICEGESVELKVDGTVTGTLAENNAYQWYKGSEKIEGATSPSYELQNATVTATADYTLTVSGKKCNSVSKTVSVVVKELPDADLTSEPICGGSSVAPKVPGTWISGWNYGWINEPAWETLSVGVHKQKYVVTAPNGCSAEGEMDVTVEEPITIVLTDKETICAGESVTLTPTITGTLADAPYRWSDGTKEVGLTSSLEVKPCENTTYTLTVTGKACPPKSSEVVVTVEKPVLKEPWPASKEDQEVCFSDGDFTPIKSETEIQALYGPDCNTVKVTFTEDKKEDDCGWYKKRTYVVTDACQHDVSPANPVIMVSGRDKEPPTLSGSLEKLAATGCDATAAPKAYTTIAELAAAGLTISDNCSADFTISSKDVEASSNCSIVVTRTYTIADACGNPATAEQEITITRADFSMPEKGEATVQCASEAKAAGEDGSQIVLPDVEDACGNKLKGVLKSVTPTKVPECEGTVTYVYTFTDCASHAHDWEFVYKIEKPKLTIPADGGSDVACLKDVKDPTAEDLEDNCGRTVTAVQDGDRIENIG